MPKAHMKLARCAGRIFDRPLLMEPEEAESLAYTFLDLIAAKEDGGTIETETPLLEDRPLYEVVGSTAIIRCIGPLVQRHDWLASFCGFVAYERLNTHIAAAKADTNVKRVVMEYDTPGGEVNGIKETADGLYALAQEKEVIAVVNDRCCSSGYFLASQCTRIVVSPTSQIGNIGCIRMHREFSEAEKMAGVKTTLIHYGRKKVFGNNSEPLSEEATDYIQAFVDTYGELFVTAVGRGRGPKFNADAARESEAATYVGEDAVTAGLADEIGYLEETLRSPVGEYPSPENDQEDPMANQNSKPTQGGNENSNPAQTQAQEPAIDVEAIKREARAEGAKAEQDRQSAIKALDEAKDRPKLTETLCGMADMTAEMAKPILAGAAVETPAKPDANAQAAADLSTQMDQNENLAGKVGSDAPAATDTGTGNVSFLADRQRKRYGMTS